MIYLGAMKAPKIQVHPHTAQVAPGDALPTAGELGGHDGGLQIKSWAIPQIAFSELRGQFKEEGPFPSLPATKGVCMLFLFEGRLRILQTHASWTLECTDQTHNAFLWDSSECAMEATRGNLHALVIDIALDHFQKFAVHCPEAWQNLLETPTPGKPASLFQKTVYLDLHLQTCLRQILDCKMAPSYREFYMEAKVMELMALQAACGDLAQQKKPRHSQTEYDRERILFAKEYLLKHMAMPPSLAKLALVSGLNEFKLKNGFREMFGNSVFAYLAEFRLDIARTALIDGNKTATEIAFELGYSSLQHFSSRFRERFGVTPTELRRGKQARKQFGTASPP